MFLKFDKDVNNSPTQHCRPKDTSERRIILFHFIKFHIHQYFFRCNTKKEKEIQSKSDKFLQTGQEPSNTRFHPSQSVTTAEQLIYNSLLPYFQ